MVSDADVIICKTAQFVGPLLHLKFSLPGICLMLSSLPIPTAAAGLGRDAEVN